MADNSSLIALSKLQKILLMLVAFVLSAALLIMKISVASVQPLDQLARSSLLPEIALANGKPTIFEFYADWCEVCQKMSPSIVDLEKRMGDKLDIVLLNVDNQRWSPLIDKYNVNGIPQFIFFNQDGDLKGISIGLLSSEKIIKASEYLIDNKELTDIEEFNNMSPDRFKFTDLIDTSKSRPVNPRSHS